MRVTKTAGFPPPTGFTQLIEVYRGVEIWYNPTSPRYWCQPTPGYVSYAYTVQRCRDYIDWVFGPPSGFPPPSGFTQLIETYRDVKIWCDPTQPRYWCQPTVGEVSYAYTVQRCRDYIDWVLGLPLSATLSASPSSGPVPLTVNFKMTMSDGTAPYTFVLSYGDGTPNASGGRTDPGTTQSNHTYTKAGTFTVTLTVTDALGATALGKAVTYAGVLPIPDIVLLISGLAPLIAVASIVGVRELEKALQLNF